MSLNNFSFHSALFFCIDRRCRWSRVRLFVMLSLHGILFYWCGLALWDDLYDNIMCGIFPLAGDSLTRWFPYFRIRLKNHLLVGPCTAVNSLIFDSWNALYADWWKFILNIFQAGNKSGSPKRLTFSLLKLFRLKRLLLFRNYQLM